MKKNKLSFNQLTKTRKIILKNSNDFFIETNSSVIITAPHGISQVRLGKNKVAEIGTIPFTFFCQKTQIQMF